MGTFDPESEGIITRVIQYFNEFNNDIEHYNSFHLRIKEINEKKINRKQLTPDDLAFEEEYDNLTYMDLDLSYIDNILDFYGFHFSKNLKQPQNLADFLIDKINDIEEYPSDLTLYSAYTNQTNLNNKNLCWFTHRIDQSILFPFDISRLDISNAESNRPHIYSFRLKQPLKLINSKSNHNMEIFDKFFPFGKYFYKKLIKYAFNEDLYNQETFAVVKNKRILYIIEAINRFISSKKSRFQKIDGYKNDLDQCEIAVIGFSNLVDKQTIKEYRITQIGRTDNFFKLPILQDQLDDFFFIIGDISYDIKSKSRMTCPENLIIKYINTNGQEPEKIFNCSCMPIDVWQKKYLKYKTKYLKVKSFIRGYH
jgi:hypothetical protein